MTMPHESRTMPPAKPKTVNEAQTGSQSVAGFSLQSLQEVDRLWAEQTALARSLFDAWLCGARQIADTGRKLCSPARAAQWCGATAPDAERDLRPRTGHAEAPGS